MNNANTYTNASYSWTASNANKWSGVNCGGRLIYYASPSYSGCVVTGTNWGMPYCWGGWSTLANHNTAMAAGKSAGDICSGYSGGCTNSPSYLAGLGCASGMDCSGFVSRAWQLSTKYNCSLLNGISSQISSTQVQQGDILNTAGHVRLVYSYSPGNGNTTVLESSARDWRVSSYTYTPQQLTSYTPRVYNNISQCLIPTNIYSSNITSTTAYVYCNAVASATQYKIGVKPSTSSTYTFYTITSLPIYLTNLLSGTTYNYKLAAYCPANGWTSYSVVYSFTTQATCGIPSGIYASNIASSTATLNWGSVNGVSYYQLQWRPSSSSTWNTVNVYSTSYGLSGLVSSTTYYFQVRAYCSNGYYSNYSGAYSFNTTYSCLTPYSIYASPITKTSAVLHWTAQNATSYNYYLKPSYSSTYTIYSNNTYNPVQFNGLSGGTTYNFKISSNCLGGTSPISSVYSFTTPTMLLPDSSVGEITISDGSTALLVPADTTPIGEVRFSPNPIHAGEELSIEGIQAKTTLSLYSLDGRLIRSIQANENIKLFHIPDGLSASIYFLKVETLKGNIYFKKLVVD
ncbi:MAG: fibronectin type III domain-containing protein [Bacteroidota bacterium]